MPPPPTDVPTERLITICHVAGRADDPASYNTLTLPYNAVYGQGGHFNEDGSPQAGHEDDSLGACPEIPTQQPTSTPSLTPTSTPTNTPTDTPTSTPTITLTPSATLEPSHTPLSPTETPTPSETPVTPSPESTEEEAAVETPIYPALPGIQIGDPALSKLGTLFPGDTGLPGEQLTWTVTVSNTSALPETGIIVSDTIRNDQRIDAVRTDQGTISFSGQDVTANIGTLNPGQSVNFYIDVTVLGSPSDGLLRNTATSNYGTTTSATLAVPAAPISDPDPVVVVNPSAENVFAGNQTCFTATFTNGDDPGTDDPGYGPYLLVTIPPGVTFDSATFLGSNLGSAGLVTLVGTFTTANGLTLIDPISGAAITGLDGGELYLIKLPIGSVVEGNPPLVTTLCVTTDPLAPIYVPLPITVTPVFEFGNTPTGDNGSIVGNTVTKTITPILVTFEKANTVPEGERPPGPTWTYNYILTATLAPGQTLTNVNFRDVMPNLGIGGPLRFDYEEGSTIIGGTCSVTGPTITEPIPANGETLTVNLGNMTETSNTNPCTVTVTYSGYILDILDEAGNSPNELPVTNTASFDGDHPLRPAGDPPLTDSTTIRAEHNVFQKSVNPGTAVPGTTLNYSVVLQITDYGTIDQMVITDTVPDGIDFVVGSANITVPGYSGPITPSVVTNGDGTLTVTFCVLDAGPTCVVNPPATFPAGTSGTLTYQGVVRQTYRATGQPVRAADGLANTVLADYSLTDGSSQQDGSSAIVAIPAVTLDKTTFSTPANGVGFVHGETVRFRLTATIPSGDTRNIVIQDFFPLPVFDAADGDYGIAAGGPTALDSITNTVGECSTYPLAIVDNPPAQFERCGIYFVASQSDIPLSDVTPYSVSVNAATNSISINIQDTNQPSGPRRVTFDVVIAVIDRPFADDLYLSNQARIISQNTPGITLIADAIDYVNVGAPVLEITKGVASTSGSGTISPITNPIDGNLTDADAGNLVTYVITVENVGGAPAYAARIFDDVPPDLVGCVLVSVTNGGGTPLAFTGNLFVSPGITLTNPLPGLRAGASANAARALVTVTCALANGVSPSQVILNTGNVDWRPLDPVTQPGLVSPPMGTYTPISDTATVTIAEPTINKTADRTLATIGEIVRYTIVADIPEGATDNVAIVDTLPAGMAFVGCVNITALAGLSSSLGAFSCGNMAPTIAAVGGQPARQATFDLGDLTTTVASSNSTLTVTIVFDAVVTDVAGNVRGTTLTNDVDMTYTSGSSNFAITDDTPPTVTVIEPTLQIDKSANPVTGDAGDTITFTIIISHTAASNADAFDVQFSDTLPTDMTCVSVTNTAGVAPITLSGCATPIAAFWDTIPDGQSSTLQITATLNSTVQPLQQITNTGSIPDYDTLPQDNATDLSPFHPGPEDRERSYNTTDPALVTVNPVTVAKTRTATSETFTSGANVVIGETVTYQVTLTVPEGVSNNVVFTDLLDNGLVFRDLRESPIGFATITFPAGVTSSIGSSTTILSNADAAVILPAGRQTTFNFGTITNTNSSNGTPEQIVITYEVVVVDIGANARGSQRNNAAQLSYTRGTPPGGTQTQTVSAANVIVVEPTLSINKTANPVTGDAGDTITFTMVISHTAASNEDAFNVVLTDIVPANMTYVAGSFANVAGVAATLNDSAAPTLTATWASLTENPDQTSTISFQATINANVGSGLVITNTANAVYDSLPENGSHPANEEDLDSPYVATDGERDYTATDPATVTVVAPNFAKSVFSTSFADTGTGQFTGAPDLAIGERIVFRMVAQIPEGVSPITITDPLPNAMSVISSRVVRIGANLSGLALAVGDPGAVAGSTVTFTFGTLTNAPDGVNTAADEIEVEIEARLLDNAANNNGNLKTNTATLNFGIGTVTSSVTMDVVEPVLTVLKTFTPPTVTAGGAGGAFTITVTNTGNANAHEVTMTDTINALLNVTSITVNLAGAPGTTLLADNSTTGSPADVDMSFDRLNIGGSIVVTVNYTVAASVTPQSVVNTGITTYDDLPTSSPDNAFDRNSTASDPDTLTIVRSADLQIVKTVNDSTVYEGDTVTFTLAIQNNGPSDASNVVVTDTLPAGLTFVNAAPPICSGSPLSCTVGNLAVGASTNIIMTATVNAGQAGNILNNVASVSATEPDPVPGNNTDNEPVTVLAFATIGDRVWHDIDADGAQDTGEVGLPGLIVTLTGTDDTGAPVSLTTTTGANGIYTFPNLKAGTYTVTVTPTAGMVATENTFAGDVTENDTTPNIVTAAGANITTVDFGYRGDSSIGDFVWHDANANGIQDGIEAGIPGVTVTLTGTDAFGNALNLTTTTDAAGNYTFDNLLPSGAGGYIVTVTPPAGTSPVADTFAGDTTENGITPGIVLPASTDIDTVDFGLRGNASIGDTVWRDDDADGVQDAGEPGIPGVTVTLTGTDTFGNPVSVTTTTDANGNYLFANLPPSNATGYTVAITPPAGVSPTADTFAGDATENGTTPNIVLAPNAAITTVDFGLRGAAQVGDSVWRDDDADGVQDAGEPGIPGVNVTLTGTDSTGAPVSFTTTTDANGNYLFANLPFSDATGYTVATSGVPLNGLAPVADTFAGDTTENGTTPAIIVDAANNNITTVDFGYQGTGSIGDTVWRDDDGDGVQDAGEPGIPGVTVTLTGTDANGGAVNVTTTTDANGNYLFDNLPPSNGTGYTVAITPPAGVSPTADTFPGDTTENGTTPNVVLAPGADILTVDFGLRGSAQVGDTVWRDDDADGVQDAGEPGIPGVTVTLTGTDSSGAPISFTTTTDANGSYLFTNLPFSDAVGYTVATSGAPLNGLAPVADTFAGDATENGTTPAIIVDAANNNITTVDFGYQGTGSIGDTVWRNDDGDGVQDAGEPGIPGVTVTLTGTDANGGAVSVTTTTDANGSYLFDNLPPSNGTGYTVTITPPAGISPTADTFAGDVTENGTTPNIVLAPNADILTVDFGLRGSAQVGDTVWRDDDADGVQDAGEPGIPSVTVTLTGTDASGAPVSFTTTTDANGNYLFTNLPFSSAAGYTVANSGAPLNGLAPVADTFAGDAAENGTTPAVVVDAANNYITTVDFGYQGTQSVSGSVWRDDDGGGTQNGVEPDLSGITVTLTGTDANGTPASFTTTTDAAGNYSFDNVPPGDYIVTVTPPAGFSVTNDAFPGDVTENSQTPITVTAGNDVTAVDFGYRGTGSLGDRIWHDQDGDGAQDAGEPGLSGLTVTLTGIDPFGNAVNLTTTTGANGIYTFANLPPSGAGDYTVTVTTPPAGTTPTFDLDGIGTAHTTAAALAPGQNRTDVDFGYQGTGSIGDRVWRDDNGDGVQDAGEPGIPGVTVTLTGTDAFGNPINATTTTGANGIYIFDNLLVGSYIVTVTPPAGMTPTFDLDGVATPDTANVPLTAGQDRTDADFGYQGLGSLGDRVWHDQDGDGLQDAGEPGLPGLTVTLAGTDAFGNAVTLTTTTGANGAYLFDDLPPSDAAGYTVTVTTPPAGTIPTFDLDGIATPDVAVATLAASQDRTDVDFGYQGTGSIGDFVWLDSDSDGVQDAGEQGIANVTVTLTGTDAFGNTVTFTTTTDANGFYLFDNLLAGDYLITVTPPAGMANTFDSNTGEDDDTPVTLLPGQDRLDVDFGYHRLPPPPVSAAITPTSTPVPTANTPEPAACTLGCTSNQVYHTNRTGDWEIFRLGSVPGQPDSDANLTQNTADDVEPSRSPDGQWIAFASNRDGNWEIYVTPMDGDTTRTQRVTRNTIAIDADPVWGPGNLVAYESTRDGNWELYVVDMETGAEYRLTDNTTSDLNAYWSPDGSKLLFQSDRTGQWQIYVMDIATGLVTALSDGSDNDLDPQYSPDGQQIVFRSIGADGRSVVHLMDASGQNRVAISDAAGDATNMAWSPDGSLIAYQSDLDGDLDIYVYQLSSEQTRHLTDNTIADYAPTWLCGTTEIIFTSDIMGNPDIFQVSALAITAPAVDVAEEAQQLTAHPAVDIYPMDAPSEENASQEGRLPSLLDSTLGHTSFLQPDVSMTPPDLSLERGEPWRPVRTCRG